MFQQIPHNRPHTPLLDSLDGPSQLRELDSADLTELAAQLREYILYSVGQSGGHFGAGLGVVELTIALHYVYDTPKDLLLWDVGHQAYPHKVLTGRREQLPSIRKKDGLSPFPKRAESEFDCFGVGHSSTSISAALGMAIAAKKQNTHKKVAAIIGDGAMTAGQAFEALNHAGHSDTDMLVILNDNDMAISENVGGLNKYFSKILSSKTYATMREGSRKVLSNIPHAWELASKTEEHVKGFFTPGILFEELGFNYIGPVDGHDIETLTRTLKNISELNGPQFLHVVTKKGKGFAPAEKDQIKYHALNPINAPVVAAANKVKTFSNVFGQWACDTAALDGKLIAITPAMREGSDLIKFSEKFPDRYFDVAIAEQHAVTLAGGMACEGAKPVVAIYSTFLQRAYDQLVHDVALQNLDVTFAVDRAGVVGADGPTHAGAYDISFMRCIPNMVIAAPSDENECRLLLNTAYQFNGPAAVRYPRGSANGTPVSCGQDTVEIGKGRIMIEGSDYAVLCFGPLLHEAKKALASLDQSITLVDMRFVKPIDGALLHQLALTHKHFITLEDNAIMGGAGSAVLEYAALNDLNVKVKMLGVPDAYIEHGSQAEQWAEMGIDAAGIQATLEQLLLA